MLACFLLDCSAITTNGPKMALHLPSQEITGDTKGKQGPIKPHKITDIDLLLWSDQHVTWVCSINRPRCLLDHRLLPVR